jgi:hypothetical protein
VNQPAQFSDKYPEENDLLPLQMSPIELHAEQRFDITLK